MIYAIWYLIIGTLLCLGVSINQPGRWNAGVFVIIILTWPLLLISIMLGRRK